MGVLVSFTPTEIHFVQKCFSCIHVSEKQTLRSISSSHLHFLSFEGFCLDFPLSFPSHHSRPINKEQTSRSQIKKKATKTRGGGGRYFLPPSPPLPHRTLSTLFPSSPTPILVRPTTVKSPRIGTLHPNRLKEDPELI